eukprot:IDg20455t1
MAPTANGRHADKNLMRQAELTAGERCAVGRLTRMRKYEEVHFLRIRQQFNRNADLACPVISYEIA